MNSAVDLVMLHDIMKLPRDTLEELGRDLEIDVNTTVQNIAQSLWRRVEGNTDLRRTALEPINDRILGGKTSVTWYTLETGASLVNSLEILIQTLGFNPLEQVMIPDPDTLTSQPVIIGGCPGERESQYYLRMMYRSGYKTVVYGTGSRTLPMTAVKTVFIDEDLNLIEVRTDSRSSSRFAKFYAHLIGQEITLSQRDIMAPYGYNLERIADLLGGELIDATARPEIMLESLDEETVAAIFNILSALNEYFQTGDNTCLENCLQESRNAFSEAGLMSIPFTALILCGLEKIGMGASGRDLRQLPIYNYFRPHIQNQGGFIQFRVLEDGMNNTYTIRVGLETKSVYFMTAATEAAIRFVRERLIMD